MNAVTQITDGVPLIDFDAVYARFNAWRGHMIENFARTEQATTKAILMLNATCAEVKGDNFRFSSVSAMIDLIKS